MTPPSAFGAPPQGGDTYGLAKPDPWCPLDRTEAVQGFARFGTM
ncbi:hypothetical protein WIT60_10535 [Aquabacterium sp. G14]